MVLKGEKNIGYSFYNFLGVGDRSDICKPGLSSYVFVLDNGEMKNWSHLFLSVT